MNQITKANTNSANPNDTFNSITILQDNSVSLKVYAPLAKDVHIGGSDIPFNLIPAMKKLDSGIWEAVTKPIKPGAYRYNFVIDNVETIDPKNPLTSQSNMNTWSLLYVPGNDFMDTKDVPHGSVSQVTYFSKSLNAYRRMHVYTPPGYEAGKGKYPVFYLLHGAYDCDNSWSTVGRAGFIFDNLIAGRRMKEMIVVMPAGHTREFDMNSQRDRNRLGRDEFINDFNSDIRPYIESHYRTINERNSRAIAGLSMGGAHTLNIGIPNLKDFGYLGVFSSGIFGITDPNYGKDEPKWDEKNKKMLSDKKTIKSLKLFWVAIGKDDFLLATSRETVNLLKKYDFDIQYKETSGAHTWENWREYLNEFAPLLFR